MTFSIGLSPLKTASIKYNYIIIGGQGTKEKILISRAGHFLEEQHKISSPVRGGLRRGLLGLFQDPLLTSP
jgi:hypothetical protein